ncbi:MAG: Asp-tRNA(Asn)/Glu-tRNA(Gln) amidotransferase subunit GatA [Deltaproteobacteria bacterium]|nr:MAG: Asp-tRNA(Asn)/Glu-tRNA(Gln) amidotransferase subunit GatA [Deltaproteobacteria bacterium]
MELYRLTIHEMRSLLDSGEVTAEAVTRSIFERIRRLEPEVAAYITLLHESAMEQARYWDQRGYQDREAVLAGIPLAVKDVICTKGVRTTCGSRILADFIPPFDSTVAEKLKRAGCILLGKTNMDEFAMGSSNENSAFTSTRNPWSLDHIPGGSSGGSAAAVSADECIAAMGSDTGGSIRQPASHCGVVGLKPTYGRVSRYGLVAFASSFDQIGPITKDVTDAAILLNVIAGYDRRDSTSVPAKRPDYTQSLVEGLQGITVGIPRQYFVEGMDLEVDRSAREAIRILEHLGAKAVDVSLPHTEYGVAAYYIIAPCEASSNLARYDGVKYGYRSRDGKTLMEMYRKSRSQGFGPEVKRRIMLGTYALSAGYYDAYYKKASQVRTLIREDFLEVFKQCQVLVTPVAPTPAFALGEKVDDPLQMYLSDVFTLPASLAGIPGLAVPCGCSSYGLPIGLQILAPHFEEGLALRVGYNLEKNTDVHHRHPPLD